MQRLYIAAVRKAVTKVRFLLGVYMLQSSKHVFSNKTVDATCRLCRLESEDIRHTVTRCPAFNTIRASTLNKLRDIISEKSDIGILCFKDWDSFLNVIVDPVCIAGYVFIDHYMSRDMRKSVLGVSDQIRHKPSCSITGKSKKLSTYLRKSINQLMSRLIYA